MCVAKRLSGVSPEVNFRDSQIRLFAQGLKPRGDTTTNPKTGAPVAPKMDMCLQKIEPKGKRKKYVIEFQPAL